MKAIMINNQASRFKAILKTMARELGCATRNRESIVIEKTAEPLDSIIGASERDLAVRTLETQSAKLREVRAALRRIDEGSFGICMECDERISDRRLAALPAAALCIRCQQESDCRSLAMAA